MAFAATAVESNWEAMHDLSRIQSKNRIIDVARELGLNINRSTIPCLHHERHQKNSFPTMTFNLLNNTFKCWVCSDVGGTVIDLVQQVKGIDRRSAVEYLAIRSDLMPTCSTAPMTSGDMYESGGSSCIPEQATGTEPDHEEIYEQFLNGFDQQRLVDMMAFVSLKGGTGKSLIVNNLAMAYGLLTRYIAEQTGEPQQEVELIDLDFGKPDQRILCGKEPDRYLEDIFYHRREGVDWDSVRRPLPLDAMHLVSTSPVRRSANLFYLHKNEMIYLVNDSSAKIKLADFGGGINKDILDFLNSIRSKICVINGERTSQEAIFNLILAIMLDQTKKVFARDKEVESLIEKLRECRQNGYRVSDFQFELERLDTRRRAMQNLNAFFRNMVEPLKRRLGMANGVASIDDPDQLKQEIVNLQAAVHAQIFRVGKSGQFDQKLKLYREMNQITDESRNFESLSARFRHVLKNNKYGLIVNKTDAAAADGIQLELNQQANHYLGQPLRYLGNLREDKALRNISNRGMPLMLADPELDAMRDICHIADNLMGLKTGSMQTILKDQRDYIRTLRSSWNTESKRTGTPMQAVATA
jgi:MinD-like ATPase involved in chromosome partitioning or flagellar assembly